MKPTSKKPAPLSPQQVRVCELASRGLPDKAIAAELGMSFGTLRTHWQRAFSRLHVHTRTEAALLWALARQPAPVGNPADSKVADTTARRHLRK